MADEILETTTETPVPPVVEETPAPVQAAPPAASLVIEGEVKSERELQLEKQLAEEQERAKRAEVIAAEWQDKATRTPTPPAPAPKKVKRKLLLPTMFDNEGDDE
jgi:hypothetical protein